jgi:hypothetical protein
MLQKINTVTRGPLYQRVEANFYSRIWIVYLYALFIDGRWKRLRNKF